MTSTIKADSIIFDLDGTLWDAASACSAAWSATFSEFGFPKDKINEEIVRAVSGLKVDVILREHFTFIPPAQHSPLIERYKYFEGISMKERGGDLYAGVKETLPELREKFRLFVVSNCLAGYIENFISFHHLQNIFEDLECYGNTGLPKADNIRALVKRNELKSPVYVGDTLWDLEASMAAGLPFIHAAYGFGEIERQVSALGAFSELGDIVVPVGK